MTGPLVLAAVLAAAQADSLAPRLIDNFERVAGWTAHPADGVTLTLWSDAGHRGRAMRLDFAFAGGGYAIARKALALDLPPNYAFSFWIRGEAAPNTLEFKLIGVRAAFLDARLVPLDSAGTVTVRRLPAEVRFVY
ncbi:MAG: hypothetical protein Q8Q85_13790 [Gemmatimonadales bacterium]|nr:hypothetical protein [Gemmatimonadales bacterium]